MQFTQLTPTYLIKDVAIPVATFCIKKYGKKGFRTEQALHPQLQWRPSVQLKTSEFQILSIEVSELVYPAILKTVSHDLLADHSDKPIVVCVACPFAVYQADARHSQVSNLRAHGFGLFTVDDLGHVIEQVPAIPLIHHISEKDFGERIECLPNQVQVLARRAYGVYRGHSYQGLQDIAQVVEALIFSLAQGAKKKGWITRLKTDAAVVLDDLYASTERTLINQRAAIGQARGFIRNYRNISSHPPKNTAAAATLIKRCREGFLSAPQVADDLAKAIRACGLTLRLNIP